MDGEPAIHFLIVPTLRCNLHCSYCQVSRVDEQMKGFDWNDKTINKFFEFIYSLQVT